jgi:tetratricopeptide (TPR) repeat protein
MKEKWEEDRENSEYRFQYACALSRSGGIHAEEEKREAIGHFSQLVDNDILVEDSLYQLALTEYFLADYEFARLRCEELYRKNPDNNQV